MSKIRYEIDPHNRLVITGLNKFRTVLDGEFKVGPSGDLIYHVKKSDALDVPQQVKLKGTWSLNRDHELVYTLDKWGNQVQGNKLVLKSDLISSSGNEIVFGVETKEAAPERRHSYLLKFSGIWQADKYNRLTFHLEKETGPADVLTLQGTWCVNKQNEIVYSYARTSSASKEKAENNLVLRGRWDITKKNRITYALDHDIGSELNFKVAFQRAEKNFIKYSIGAGYAAKAKTISLSGAWRWDKNLGLVFEVEYENGRAGEIVFGADARWNGGYSAELKLKNKRNDPLGIEVVLSKQLFKDQGEAFLKTAASREGFSIVAGAGIRW